MTFDFTKEPGRSLMQRDLCHDGMPLVSIITPFYNSGTYFEQTWNCVMNQTFPWFEWLIVDDGSTDAESRALLERLAGNDARIRVIRQANSGPAAARNHGASLSRTDILVMLDADDLIAPVYLEKLYWALRCHPECAWAYTNSVGFQEQEYTWDKPFDPKMLVRENFLNYSAAIRKDAFRSVGGYDTEPRDCHEDWIFWVKLLAAGHRPVKTAGFDFWYRRLSSGRMAAVNGNAAALQKTKEMIRQLEPQVDRWLTAEAYPRGAAPGGFYAPRTSQWQDRTFATHSKTHVLMLLPWLEMGGADLFNLEICARLDRERFEVGIITTQPCENTWQQRFSDHAADIFHLPEFLDVKDWAEFIHYYIASRQVDVLFLSNSYYGYYLLPWLRRAFPDLVIIDYVHSKTDYWRSGGFARTSGVMGEILEKTYVCNEHTRRELLRDFCRAPDSVETLYIGVDAEKFDAACVAPGQARGELGIDAERPIVLFPCRIHPEKRPFLMLAVAEALHSQLPDVAFVVVGDGPQLDELQIAVQQHGLTGTVYFAGRQSDMRPWYRDAAVTLICSLNEGLALTAYESLSMSTPVVSADVGGQAELIDDTVGRIVPLLQNSESSLDSRDFPPEEVAQYVEAIGSVLADPHYTDVCAACRRRIEQGFSTRLMIQKLESILETLQSDPEMQARRRRCAQGLRLCGGLADELVTTMGEIQAYEDLWKNSHSADTKSELMRIANSKWGRRFIKLAFKLKLNRLFR